MSKLGEICKISSSKRIFENEYQERGIPFVRGQEISDGSLLSNSCFNCYISKERFNEIKVKYGVPQKGDILITAVGTIGNVCFLNKDIDFYFKDGNVLWLRNFSDNVVPEYLYFYLKSPFFKKIIGHSLIGAVQKALTMQMLSEIDIQLPPIKYQNSVVTILKSIEYKISNNNKINAELESLAKTIYDYWFLQFEFPNEDGKPYKSSGGKMVWNEKLKREIPEGWAYSLLKDKFSIKRGVSYSSDDIKNNNGIPMLNLACIDTNRNYRDGELKFYSGKAKAEFLSSGDLIVACTDLTRNADIVGSPILVPQTGENFIFSMDLVKLIPNKDIFDKYYLYMCLRTDFYHNYIKKWASGTNVLHLNLDGISWYKTWIPPMELQNKFSNIIKKIHSKKGIILKENRELSSLREFLLPLLMNGQVGYIENE